MQDERQHFFISYAKYDETCALRLQEDLACHHFRTWIACSDNPAGNELDNCIREAIKKSFALLYLASPNSRSSRYVQHELELALMYGRRILPLWIAGSTAWADVAIFGYSGLIHIDLRLNNYNTGLTILMQELGKLLRFDATTSSFHSDQLSYKGLSIEPGLSVSVVHEEHKVSNFTDKATASTSIKKPSSFGASVFEKVQKLFSRPFQHNTTTSAPAPEPVPSLRNPYKGLYAFKYDDAKIFFGRERVISDMVRHVNDIVSEEKQYSQSSRCILVVGTSGAGKSSVVTAGLLPRLQENQPIPEIKRWLFLEPVSPGEHPIRSLASTFTLPFLNKEAAGSSALAARTFGSLRQELENPGGRGLLHLLQCLTPDSGDRVVLVIDQLEELFAPAVEQDERERFIDLLYAAATEPNSRVLIIMTLRADFYDYVLTYPRLFPIIESHKIDISPMTMQELREVIVRPAEASGVTFDPDLTVELALRIYEQPGALPLLQFVLEKLFQEREGHLLTRHSYEALGGLQGALNRHAEHTYRALPSEQHREYVRRLFTEHLIHIMVPGEELSRLESGEGITRRRVTRAELGLDDPQNTVARETIDAFTEARLLIPKSSARESTRLDESTYEISHEALINAWEDLRKWIATDREDIYLVQRLRPQIEQWRKEQKRKKRSEFLVEGRELQQLQDFDQRKSDVLPDQKSFLNDSLQRRKAQRLRGFIPIGIAVVVVLIAAPFIVILTSNWLRTHDPSRVISLSNDGSGSLRQAIAQAAPGTTITLDPDLAGKTIFLSSNLPITKRITIRGLANSNIIISSGDTGSFISIAAGSDVIFENITFADSYTHKNSFIENEGNLTMISCMVKNNRSYRDGGAIANEGYLTLNDTILSDNQDNGDGGAIYNLFGTININGGQITRNLAYNNGGGIYSAGGHVEILRGQISFNRVEDTASKNNYGGGVDIVDGSLDMSDNTKVFNNYSRYYGGGIAIQGSLTFISDTTVYNNQAGEKGGGIIVAINTDNNFSSLMTLRDITVADKPNARYYIGKNESRDNQERDIAGQQKPVGSTLQITEVTNVGIAGNPSPGNLSSAAVDLVGVANINTFCQDKGYSYGQLPPDARISADNHPDITIECIKPDNEHVSDKQGPDFPGNQVCQDQFAPGGQVVDHIINYSDPSTLGCYKNLKLLGPIGQNPADFAAACKKEPQNPDLDTQNAGLYDNHSERKTAYDWRCQPRDSRLLPRGLSVANACVLKYNNKNALDRLVNYNRPDGWECWAPA